MKVEINLIVLLMYIICIVIKVKLLIYIDISPCISLV